MTEPIIRMEIKDGKYTESIIGYSWDNRADWPSNELYPTEDVPGGAIAPGFARSFAEVPIQCKEASTELTPRAFMNADKTPQLRVPTKEEKAIMAARIEANWPEAPLKRKAMGIMNSWNTHE